MNHKLISITKNNKNSSSIYLFKLFKKINAFETQISYCIDYNDNKYFTDSLIGAKKIVHNIK
jgi:hypothetical protein